MHIRLQPETRRVQTGDLFGYILLEPGQYFVGEITCANEATWEALRQMVGLKPVGEVNELRLGRASRRGYGKVSLVCATASKSPWQGSAIASRVTDPDKVILTLLSDAIVTDPWGRFEQGFEADWLKRELACRRVYRWKLRLRTSSSDASALCAWWMHSTPSWDCRGARDVALVAGSGVRLMFKGIALPELQNLLDPAEQRGIGLRRDEGFGRVAFNHPIHQQCANWNDGALALGDLALGSALQDHDQVRVARFEQEWREKLDDKINPKLFAHPPFETVARLEHVSGATSQQAAAAVLDGLGKQEQLLLHPLTGRDKKNFYETDGRPGVNKVFELLGDLGTLIADQKVEATVEPRLWRIGLQMLADRIARTGPPQGPGGEVTMKFRAITATLKLRTPLHVGTGAGTETADDLVRRDARGRLLIPGTALAGTLRGIATRSAPRFPGVGLCHALKAKDPQKACGCLVCQLFGDVNPQEDDEAGNATRLVIYDAILDSAPQLQIRDGVGIDRTTGAAARREHIKFDLEVLPAETMFKLRIELDRRLTDDAALRLLAATLAEWQAGRGAVGGRVARGLGAFDLVNVQFIERELDRPDVLMAFLRDGPPWDAKDGKIGWIAEQIPATPVIAAWEGNAKDPVARSWALAEFTLAATGPFLTHDLTQAGRSGFDHAPVLEAYALGEKPVLPGSSLRGVLRSQAERIARTLATLDAWDAGADHNQRRNAFLTALPSLQPVDGADVRRGGKLQQFHQNTTEERPRETGAGRSRRQALPGLSPFRQHVERQPPARGRRAVQRGHQDRIQGAGLPGDRSLYRRRPRQC